ncbi:putative MFS monocarboxylate transporter (Mct) [Aspergillus lucknowensis]|uniref:Major facilitator superfamily domain-containing protein n=1 Tax=Aspergillus lucknowensis TaxID=176173 RepID=A0ABR4LF28_9EURO
MSVPPSDLEKPAPQEEPAPESMPWHPSQYPDGGLQAWLVVAGAFCCLFCSFGWINCIGMFQSFYETHQLQEYSASEISWIASLELFIMFSVGPIIGRIYDRQGPRYLLLFGTFMHVFGLMMASLGTEYYQILLAQGVCSSIGISCLFTPATYSTLTWFHRRRGLAIGIVAAGSSLGGVLFPIMFDHLITDVGFAWAIRIAAFLILAMLIFGNLTVRSRIKPFPKNLRLIDYLKPLRERVYLLTSIGSFVFYLGMFLPINYIQVQATAYGMRPDLGNYLIPILNAASLFGRIFPGWLGDRMGNYNAQILMSVFSGTLSLALWIPAKDNALVIVFAALYGFGSGAFVALLPAMIAQISDIKEIGTRTGVEFAIMSVAALVSNPIGGALIRYDPVDFSRLQIFCGTVLLGGAFFFALARMALAGPGLVQKV